MRKKLKFSKKVINLVTFHGLFIAEKTTTLTEHHQQHQPKSQPAIESIGEMVGILEGEFSFTF